MDLFPLMTFFVSEDLIWSLVVLAVLPWTLSHVGRHYISIVCRSSFSSSYISPFLMSRFSYILKVLHIGGLLLMGIFWFLYEMKAGDNTSVLIAECRALWFDLHLMCLA